MSVDSVIKPKVRFLCLPDIDRPIGGVKQLYRHAEHLCSLGWDASIVTQHSDFRLSWFKSSAPTIGFNDSVKTGELNDNSTILVLPETYISTNLSNLFGVDISASPRVIFNQNAYYTYGELDVDVNRVKPFYHSPNVLQVLCVSEDSHSFLKRNLSIKDDYLSRIINAVDSYFYPSPNKHNIIHWMPRKNYDHVRAVLTGLQSTVMHNASGWSGSPLDKLSHFEVASQLNNARIFLAFGHPEGFGLPIAEAMASGCWVVGYSGGGGKELFRLGGSSEVSFGDWHGYLRAIDDVLNLFVTSPCETSFRLERQSLAVRTLYSTQSELSSIKSAWDRIFATYQSSFSTSTF